MIQLLLNSGRTPTSARHNAYLVTCCASRVVTTTLHMIATLHMNALTRVDSVMNIILEKIRSVDSGILFYIIITSLLTPSQGRTFRATCVCLEHIL